MGITGSDPALMYSRAGLARFGATRADYYQPMVYITINGVQVQSRIDSGTLHIEQTLGQQPDVADLEALTRLPSTFLPEQGQEIVIGLGAADNRVFAGRILATEISLPRVATARPRMRLSCIDYTWELGHQRCRGRQWEQTSATAIADDLVREWAPAFASRAQFGLPAVDFEVGHREPLPTALSRLASLVGAKWYVDYRRGVRLFTAYPVDGNAVAIADGDRSVWQFQYREDLSQVRTRTFVVGAATRTTDDLAVGATSIPVQDVRIFAAGGGTALIGLHEVSYTGRSADEGPGSLTGVPASGGQSLRYPVENGAPVAVLAIESDSAAQTALAAVLGGSHDGVIDHLLENGTYVDAAAHLAGDGDLETFSDTGEQGLSYVTRSKAVRPGKTVTLTMTTPLTLAGTLTIQRVSLSSFTIGQHRSGRAAKFPLRHVEASKAITDVADQIAKLT